MAEKHVEPTIDPSLNVGDTSDSADALDKAFASLGTDVEPTADTPTPEDASDEPSIPAEQPEQTPEKADEGSAPEPEPEPEPKPAAEESAEAPLSRTPKVEETVEEDPAIKALNEVKLRADASQKTKDTFANLKEISAARIKEKNDEIARLRLEQQKAIEEARKAALEEAKKQANLPEDVQKELEELRQLRARVDVESDPAFKQQFDTKRDANYEDIFKELAQYGLKESELKVLRKIGESEKIENITEMAAKLPPASRLKIEAKLFENLNLSDAREKALADARGKAQQIWQEREGQTKAQQEQAKAERERAIASFRENEVFKKLEVPANTPPEQRKRIEATNQQREKLRALYEEVVNDETPLAKAEAAFGLVLAHQFKAELDTTKAELAAAKKELEGIKKRSGIADKGRLVNVPSDSASRKVNPFEVDAGESLDAMAKSLGLA